MKIKELAAKGRVDAYELEEWLSKSGAYSKWIKEGFLFLSFPFPYLTLSCCCIVYELFSM